MSSQFDVFGSLDDAGCYRSGGLVVLPAGGELPQRCVVCNDPCDARTEIKVQRGDGTVLPAGLALIVSIFQGLAGPKPQVVHAGLCATHLRKRRNHRIAAVASMLAALPFFLAPALDPSGKLWPILILPALVLMILAVIFARRSQVLQVSHTDHRNTYLICSQPFLLSLAQPALQAPAYNPGYPGYGGQMAPPGYAMPMYGPGWFIPPQGGFGGR